MSDEEFLKMHEHKIEKKENKIIKENPKEKTKEKAKTNI